MSTDDSDHTGKHAHSHGVGADADSNRVRLSADSG